jgi:hypothetical protein
MAVNPQQDLADALKRVHTIAPSHIVQARHLSRDDRAILKRRGFLTEIIRGWYALTTPSAQPGDTTFWHLHFWAFAAAYLKFRHGDRYCVSPEQSLDLWTEGSQTPKQLIVLTERGGVLSLKLPNNTSILLYPKKKGLPASRETKQGVQVMSLAEALTKVAPTYFTRSATNAELGLRMVRVEELSRALLSGDVNLTAMGRMIGGLRHLGFEEAAQRLDADLTAAGFSPKPHNPFEEPARLPEGILLQTPYAGRIEAMWGRMREEVLAVFPPPPKVLPDPTRYLQRVNEIYTQDAYHSLSIEGYQVTAELIQKIADGAWNPEADPTDQAQVNAMAAKGYYEAFQQVLKSLDLILQGESPGKVFARDLQSWYRALFSPSVSAHILPTSALAGYRDRRIFIKGSYHVPPAIHAVPYLMDALFEVLTNEESPAVRAVLGHFIFVFIHPYSDGNGRIGRFLMNTMLASGGYDWTVIRVERRKQYMEALERASVDNQIEAFAQFVVEEMEISAALPAGPSRV